MTSRAPFPAAALLVLALAPAGAAAQVLVGHITDRDTGRGLPGAFVILMDEAGERRAAVLADTAGRFLIRAPGPGRYRLHAERIGHETAVSSLIELAAGETLEHGMATRSAPIRLEGIAITAEGRCELAAAAGLETHRLWEEARKALDVVAWVETRGGVPYQQRLYERRLDPRSMRIIDHQGRFESGYGRAAFYSEPPDALAEHGFVRALPDDTHQYFGVDAHTLLSEPFLDTHCFRIVPPPAEEEDSLIGLAFEPVRGHRPPDIEGVLWLDRESAELRHLEFRYTRHLHPLPVPGELFGGRVDFRRLANGAWIVDQWRLRLPEFTPITPAQARERSDDWLSERMLAGVPVDLLIREVGGELPFFPEATSRPMIGDATIQGVVWDSARSRPLDGAIVFLTGSRRVAATDENGRFAIEAVPEGVDHIGFFHPLADSLALQVTTREVRLDPSLTTVVRLAIPGDKGCPAPVGLRARTAALVGHVHYADDGETVPGATILTSWRDPGFLGRFARERQGRVTADATGRYVICDVPLGVRVRLRPSAPNATGPTIALVLEHPGIARQDLLVP